MTGYSSKGKQHLGQIDYEYHQAFCTCGLKGKIRDFIYQAKEDLLNHYKKIGRLDESSGMAQGFGMKGLIRHIALDLKVL